MPRLGRAEVFAPDEIATLHVMARVVRRCFLLGNDPLTGKNFDHRKLWIEDQLVRLSADFGIDLLCFAIMSNHFHLILRSRPDVVAAWDDTEVARRWLMLCPIRQRKDILEEAPKPTEAELNSIRNDPDKLATIRTRLSDVSWWMRLLCQNIGRRANRDDGEIGRFFQGRYKAVRLLDDAAVLSCSAYVDLNLIRAAMAETLEASHHTSAQRRIQAQRLEMNQLKSPENSPERSSASSPSQPPSSLPSQSVSPITVDEGHDTERQIPQLLTRRALSPDRMLSPVQINEHSDALGACPSSSPSRCSDKGFLNLSTPEYLALLDWTARYIAPGKLGVTPVNVPPILDRWQLSGETWCGLVSGFGKLFHTVAGRAGTIDATRTGRRQRRHHMRRDARELLST